MRKICYNDESRLAPAMPVFEDVDSSPSKCEFAGCVVDVLGIAVKKLTPLLLIECRRRELRLRREIQSFSHVLWIWSGCSYGKRRNHGMSKWNGRQMGSQ
ncbi:hypothetical protein K443DRAFT_686711 [Laccaria amethystina LaAM-08-1]|uniref:Uncharacterized protein n=1 Tax=Laccaria amethystina LaAM-08-1 TaxID=1095629 RepID=A0A0C9WH44_9AGAR|nr:hypothetical protein K443DRAFT_686711 [Laccaria amethystina LaAM-08-1]